MTATNRMSPVHPGEILREEIDERDLSANALAQALHIPANRITAILNGQRGVTADTAHRLALYFGTTPEFWLNLQKTWELRRAEIEAEDGRPMKLVSGTEKWTPKSGQRLKCNLHRVSSRRAEAGCAEVHHIWRPPTK